MNWFIFFSLIGATILIGGYAAVVAYLISFLENPFLAFIILLASIMLPVAVIEGLSTPQ